MSWNHEPTKTARAGLVALSLLLATPAAFAASPEASREAAMTAREAAMAARTAGDHARAIALFEQLRAATPDDADLLRLLGTTYAFDHRYDAAIATLESAQALAPDDLDIALALARAHLWAGQTAQAHEQAQALANTAPDNAEVARLLAEVTRTQAQGDADGHPLTLTVNQGISRVSVGDARRTWYDSMAALSARVSPRTTLTGEVTREDRAGLVDTHLALTGATRLSDGASATLTVTATPNAQFREKFGLRAGTDIALTRHLALVAQARYGDYIGGVNVVSGAAGLRLHDAEDRHALTLQSIFAWNQGDGQSPGWSLRADSALTSRTSLYLAGATYPDTEAGITRRFEGLYGGLTHRFDSRLVLRAGLGWERRRDSYTRRTANLALSLAL